MKLFANITNEAIAKLFSIEFIGGLITAMFIAGVFWQSITGSIAEAIEKSDDNKASLEVLSSDVSQVKTDIQVMKRSQEDYQRYQKEVQENQTEELRDIKATLMDMARENRTHQEH
jgi:hypothetical protein